MAIIAALAVFVGFAPTYYLKGLYGTPRLSTVRHLHGIVFTLWMILFLVQTTLISAHRPSWHRRLGIAGTGLAGAILIVESGGHRRGQASAASASCGRSIPASPGVPADPVDDLVAFAVLAGSVVSNRRKPASHKRLMLLAEQLRFCRRRWGGWCSLVEFLTSCICPSLH